MIKGLYAAASAMVAQINQQKLLTHNAANMNTPGFKQTLSSLSEWWTTPAYTATDGIDTTYGNWLGNLGLGVESLPEISDFSSGALESTGEIYDVAISGEGFFCVKTPDGERLTRDGRFNRDAKGNLVTVDGYQILNSAGQPIVLPDGTPSFAQDGTVTVNGVNAGKIALVSFKDPETELTRDGENMFLAAGAPTGESVGTIEQGYLEMSNVDSASLMTQMVTVARAYEAAQKMVQNQDELLGKSISTLGKIG